MANGFYFNEIKNTNSDAQLTLYTLSDVSNRSSLNINIISNLERTRVNYLLDEGMEFSKAKKQAQSEISKIFEIEKADILESEKLDIAQSGEDNAILLAISVILQGDLSVADLSELIANIGTDIQDDGILDNENPGTTLIDNAMLLQPDLIRQNLENRYQELGIIVILPDFERYVTHFIENTSYEHTVSIEYPETGTFGKNLLSMEDGELIQGRYSLTALLSEKTNLLVNMNGQGFSLNNNPYDISNIGWDIIDKKGVYASAGTGKIELEILLEAGSVDTMSNRLHSPHAFSIEVYENGAINPNFTREFTIVRGK